MMMYQAFVCPGYDLRDTTSSRCLVSLVLASSAVLTVRMIPFIRSAECSGRTKNGSGTEAEVCSPSWSVLQWHPTVCGIWGDANIRIGSCLLVETDCRSSFTCMTETFSRGCGAVVFSMEFERLFSLGDTS